MLTSGFSQYNFSTLMMFEGRENWSTSLINTCWGHKGRIWISPWATLSPTEKIENRFSMNLHWKNEYLVTCFSGVHNDQSHLDSGPLFVELG